MFLCNLNRLKVDKLLKNSIDKLSADKIIIKSKKNLDKSKRILPADSFTIIFSSCSALFIVSYWTSSTEPYTQGDKLLKYNRY